MNVSRGRGANPAAAVYKRGVIRARRRTKEERKKTQKALWVVHFAFAAPLLRNIVLGFYVSIYKLMLSVTTSQRRRLQRAK